MNNQMPSSYRLSIRRWHTKSYHIFHICFQLVRIILKNTIYPYESKYGCTSDNIDDLLF